MSLDLVKKSGGELRRGLTASSVPLIAPTTLQIYPHYQIQGIKSTLNPLFSENINNS